eukprot:7136166-Prymnesium_polylepis.2
MIFLTPATVAHCAPPAHDREKEVRDDGGDSDNDSDSDSDSGWAAGMRVADATGSPAIRDIQWPVFM